MIPWGATIENSKWRNCRLHSFSLVFLICCILLSGCYRKDMNVTEFGPTNPHFIAMSTADAVDVIRACFPQNWKASKYYGDNHVIYYEEGETVTRHKDLVRLDTTEITIYTYGEKAVPSGPYHHVTVSHMNAPATFVPYSEEVTKRFSDVNFIIVAGSGNLVSVKSHGSLEDLDIRPSAEAERKGITLFKLASAFVTLSPNARAECSYCWR